MPFITSDQIRDISVKTVEMFLNNKIPLSEGLAKQASALELNSDQIHRAVEATNSIAYLKVLSLSSDRTVEFPLCKYAEVMKGVVVPDLTKAASWTVQKPASTSEGMEKVASAEANVELNDAEKRVMFTKLAAINEKELEALRDREVTIKPEIEKLARLVKADPEGLEKLATVVSGPEFSYLSEVVYGEAKAHSDTGLFKAAELKTVEKFATLIKEAQAIESDIKIKQELADRGEHIKQAFFWGALGRGVGAVLGKTAKPPINMVANAAKRTGHNIGVSASNAATSLGNQVRKAGGMPLKPLNLSPKKKFGLGAAATMGISVGADAMMYTPGTDSTTGRSKDVWTSLQREPN